QANDGSPVAAWADVSGNGRDLTAFDATATATLRANAVNGHAAVEFNGTSSLLKTYNSTFTVAQPDTFFVVYRSLDPNTADRAFLFDSRTSSTRQVLGRPAAGQIRIYANIDMDTPSVTYPFPNYQLWDGTFNGSSSRLALDGAQVATGNAGGS